MMTPTEASTQRGRLAGVTQAAPIMLGYIPIGLAFGVLAQKAGMSSLNTLLMSILVYAGSSQLIAIGLFAAGAPVLSVILTTFVVNLRHMLMSAALSPLLGRWRKVELAAFAYQLTDETFAIHSARLLTSSDPPNKAEVFGINMTAQVAWIFGTWLGTVVGQLITDVKPFALDYALPAMFVALLVLQIKDRVQIAVAFLTGVLAVGLLLLGVEQWHVIAATLVGATIGVISEKWAKKISS
ncbi:MAG: AzlC family ABC transporter permease [Chloroflexota bacterium]|nr:AzlC family ABC transporter permease [Chloroflexota bacterium]